MDNLLITQQRQVLNLFERIADPFTPNPDVPLFSIPDIVFPSEEGSIGDVVGIPPLIVRGATVGTPDPAAVPGKISVPGLELVKSIPRGRLFSTFHPSHREAAYRLVRIFKTVPTVKDLIDLAAIIRDQVNEQIFVFAWSAALIQRPDTRSLRVPPIWEVFPDKFLESTVFSEAQTRIRRAGNQPVTVDPIIIDRNFAATDRVNENRLSYFREDLGINSHHWHWHLINPVDGNSPPDRRGELFYYMHQQILARYDAERIANNLARVTSYHDFTQPIAEAYFPKLTAANGAIHWGSRPSGLIPKDINIPDNDTELGMAFQIHDLDRWRTRILHAIHKGSVEGENGQNIPLDEETGINILGELIEASNWSPNKLLYGDLHNFGHMAFCYIHDPDGGHLENMSVMGDSTTAMRDPLFYRWHKFTDSLFQQFKSTLQPYSNDQLAMRDITLNKVEVTSVQGPATPKNLITTGWQESLVELSRGLDFSSQNPVQARVTHLQHHDFNFRIQGTNTAKMTHRIVFRIFIAPIQEESGRRFSFREQRQLMIELDKFVVKVAPGKFDIKRSSNDSSVTIPFERTFRELERPNSTPPLAPGGVPTNIPTDARTNFCGCGWPDHFLVPRGTLSGMPFTLFVMATNWKEDSVVNEDAAEDKMCRNAASYCGILDQKYPDKRAMGFPFDRPAASNITSMTQFTTPFPNMKTNEIRIQFQDQVIRRYPQ